MQFYDLHTMDITSIIMVTTCLRYFFWATSNVMQRDMYVVPVIALSAECASSHAVNLSWGSCHLELWRLLRVQEWSCGSLTP